MVMETQPPGKARVLIFSSRNIDGNAHYRCPHFEFEDIICKIDSAELFAPKVDVSSLRFSFATRLAYRTPITLNPGIHGLSNRGRYDVLFTICAFPQDLLMFSGVSNFRDISKTSVCLLDELWIADIAKHRHFLRILEKFDVVLLYYSQTVKPLSELIKKRCSFLPPGIDAISFCPYPDPVKRAIDVYSIGRRSQITHQKLLEWARETRRFYLHDTIRGSQTINSKEHRAALANAIRRSQYFIVNPGKIDDPSQRGQQIEIGNRYFEGAASGAIMIGERPDNEAFKTLFDWPDAVTRVPYNSSDIDMIINDLDADPERQDRIRRTGVVQALTRHDWVYRWEAVLKLAGLAPLQAAEERKVRLRKLAEIASQG
jgi:Glycosyl transferases group 1